RRDRRDNPGGRGARAHEPLPERGDAAGREAPGGDVADRVREAADSGPRALTPQRLGRGLPAVGNGRPGCGVPRRRPSQPRRHLRRCRHAPGDTRDVGRHRPPQPGAVRALPAGRTGSMSGRKENEPWSHARVVRAAPRHAASLERLQAVCFPYLGDAERMKAEHFLAHQMVFPEGEFVAVTDRSPDGSPLSEEVVIGLGSGFLTRFDLEHPDHSFLEIIAGGTYANHDPEGDWYYGADMSVH